MKTCECCGLTIKDEVCYYETDNDYVCEECYENEYYTCEDCGRVIIQSDMYNVHDRSGLKFVCDECSNDYYTCEDCGSIHDYNNLIQIHTMSGSTYDVCNSCFESGDYYYCEDCGNYYHRGDMTYDEESDEYYCDECYEENHVSLIMNYHEFNDWQVHCVEHENESIIKGFELEVCGNDNKFMTEKVRDILGDFVVFERDSSIGSGFEIISHPFTTQYLSKNRDSIKNALDRLLYNGYSSDNNYCGLHIHVSRKSLVAGTELDEEQVIDNMLLILETFKEELITFSRRSEGQLDEWCSFLTQDKSELSYKFIKEKKRSSGRYKVLNLTNSKTVEFRLFRGTLDYRTFMAAMELIDNIVNIAKRGDLDGLSWNDIVGCRDTNIGKYVEDLRIVSETVLKIEEFIDSEKEFDYKAGDKIVYEHDDSVVYHGQILYIHNDGDCLVGLYNFPCGHNGNWFYSGHIPDVFENKCYWVSLGYLRHDTTNSN